MILLAFFKNEKYKKSPPCLSRVLFDMLPHAANSFDDAHQIFEVNEEAAGFGTRVGLTVFVHRGKGFDAAVFLKKFGCGQLTYVSYPASPDGTIAPYIPQFRHHIAKEVRLHLQ